MMVKEGRTKTVQSYGISSPEASSSILCVEHLRCFAACNNSSHIGYTAPFYATHADLAAAAGGNNLENMCCCSASVLMLPPLLHTNRPIISSTKECSRIISCPMLMCQLNKEAFILYSTFLGYKCCRC